MTKAIELASGRIRALKISWGINPFVSLGGSGIIGETMIDDGAIENPSGWIREVREGPGKNS